MLLLLSIASLARALDLSALDRLPDSPSLAEVVSALADD